MSKTIVLLAEYVNSASDLAELLKKDLTKGREISDAAIFALHKFQKAAHALGPVTNELNKYMIKNN